MEKTNALAKSLAIWSWPSKRSRTESSSGLDGRMCPIGRHEPRLQTMNESEVKLGGDNHCIMKFYRVEQKKESKD